jgi:Short C-terminal domain
VGTGFIRKALFVATAGLSGRVFKDNSKKQRTAKADAKRVRPLKETKVKRPKPQAAPRKPQAARRPKPQAAPRKPQAARASTVAPIVGSGNGTTNELERLADLYGRGALTDEEFAAAKARILETSPTPHGSDRSPATFPAVESNVAAARRLADLAAHDDASIATVSSD